MADIVCPTCGINSPAGAVTCASCGTPLADASEAVHLLQPGTRLCGEAYTVGKALGQGGFGITYLGSDTRLLRPVAIKEFFPHGCVRQSRTVRPAGGWTAAAYADARSRFFEEGQTLARFNHPGIVRVHTGFEENGTAYIVMEYLHGKSLGSLAQERGGRLPEAEAVAYLLKAGEALAEVHQAGLLHRDIKPDNIMVAADGRVVLIDFGTAKEYAAGKTQAHTVTLTPGFAPLEQYAQRAQRGAYTDVYALAATLYSLLTGEPPVAATDRAVGVELAEVRRLNPQVSETVAQAVMQGLALEVARRPRSVREFLHLLGGTAQVPPAPSPRSAPEPEPARPRETATPEEIIVSPQGGSYRSISEAVRAAPPGARIRVRPGRYHGGLVLDKPVEIIGEGRAEDIVLESSASNCLLVQTERTLVRGLSLRGRSGRRGGECVAVEVPCGRLVLEDCDVTSDSLTCVAIHGAAAAAEIRRCRIHDSSDGPGVLFAAGSRGTVEGCVIFNNRMAGIEIREGSQCAVENCDVFGNAGTGVQIGGGSNPTLRGCRIHDGKGSGLLIHDQGLGLLENCDIFANAFSGVEIREAANPRLQGCRIYDGREAGVLVHTGGLGTLEECEIFRNALSGIMIQEGSSPVIQRCRIHTGTQAGILVNSQGSGTVDDCEIFGNGMAGMEIVGGGEPVVRRCRINRNKFQGVYVHDGGAGTVEDCDLAGNAGGAWSIQWGCRVRRARNKE
jgi:F-box protein 11